MTQRTSSRREREREARRQAILDAAEAVIRRRGFADTTMDEVAAEAELSKGALYLYFANKDALCAALVERTLQRVRPALEQVVSQPRPGLERFLEGLRREAEFIDRNPHLLRMMVGWMLTGLRADTDEPALESYRSAVRSMLELAVRAVAEGQQDGSIRTDVPPFRLALQSWAGLIGVLLVHVSRDDLARRLGDQVDTKAVVDLYLEQMARALRPQGPSQRNDEEAP